MIDDADAIVDYVTSLRVLTDRQVEALRADAGKLVVPEPLRVTKDPVLFVCRGLRSGQQQD